MLFTSEGMKWMEYVAYVGLMRNASNERRLIQSNPNTLYPRFDIQF